MSGWMYLISLIPYVGALFVLVAACLDSKPANQWGPNPKDGQPAHALAWQPAPPQAPMLPPAGWYSDPSRTARLRYWDGGRWTEHVSN